MSRPRGRPAHPDVLTPAEWAVLDLYRHGLGRQAIARLRGTGDDAVRFQLRSVRDKLGVMSISQLRTWTGFPSTSPIRHSARRAGRMRAMDGQLSLGQLGQISMLCRSAAATEIWYRDVLRLNHLYSYGPLVFFDCDGTRLYFREVPDGEWRKSSTLYFVVPDITAAYTLLTERGVAFIGAPHLVHRHDSGDEEWMAFLDDPDGNTIALMSVVSAAGA